ncbi:hypothetical protein EV426DRAFT_577362 [Tirmania nivea]|nr:hypothetical protein EV426DRAFT_577362 [Tirmania nivea]
MASVGVIPVTLIPSPTNATAQVTAASLPETTSNQAAEITKPIRKSRPPGSHAQAATSQPWSSSKCFRHLRPFTSKITALKAFLQSTPSAVAPKSTSISAANPNASIPAAEALSALIVSTCNSTGSGASLRRTGEVRGAASEYRYGRRTDEEYRPENDINNGGRRRAGARAPVRTYGSGAGTMLRTNSFHVTSEVSTVGGASTAGKATNINGSNSYTHLMAQQQSLNSTLFGLYLAIYQGLSQLLQTTMAKPQKSTQCPSPEASSPPTIPIGAPSLVTLATRALAHCILATSPTENLNSTLLNYNQTNRDQKPSNKQQEIPQSDWYDEVQDVSATYLPTLLRFHVIEVIAQSIRTRGIDCNLGSMLAGLCYELGAMHEGDVIVRELLQLDERRGVGCIYIYLLCASKEKNPGFLARGWRILKEHGSQRLPEAGIDVLANMMGGVGNRVLRERAWKDWMYSGIEEAKEFVSESMRIAFGVWGSVMRNDVRMKMCRMDKLKRSGNINSERAAIGVSMMAVGKLRKLVYGNNTLNKLPAKKIEDLVLEFLDVIAKTALGLDLEMESVQTSQAKDVLWDLVEGFLGQSGEVRNVVEAVWGRGEIGGGRVREYGLYPKDAKVLVLLFVLVGLESEEKREQVSREIARVLDEEKYAAITTEKLAAMNSTSTSIGETTSVQLADDIFMENIVQHLLDFYNSDGISAELGQEGVRKLVKVLMDIAFPTVSRPASTIVNGSFTETNIPATPAKKTLAKKLTWTPAVNTLSPEDEATSIRYYHSRLALLLATRFSSLPETKYSEKWVEWVEEIEKKILCIPIPTPARKPAHHQRRRKAPGEKSYKSARKPKHGSLGWKFEEGLGTWIARTGTTPYKNGVLSVGALGAAVRRSSRLSFTSEEGAEEAGGRKWVFDGVVLTPMGLRSRDGYELFFTSDKEESEESEESEEESDEAIGVTEREDNEDLVPEDIEEDVPRDEAGEVIRINTSDEGTRSPLSPIVKKRSIKYVLPTSASSLSSEREYDSRTESPSGEPCSTSSYFSPLIPPASTRRKRLTRSTASINTPTCTPYHNMRQCNQRHRQSNRTAALARKSYVVPDSSSADEGEDSWIVGQDETPNTSLSMLSSPPPEEKTISKLRRRRAGREKKQLSLFEFIGGDSPVPARTVRAGTKLKTQALDTPGTGRSLRKRAKVEYKEEDTEGGSISEADNGKDEDFAISSASKGKKRARMLYEEEESSSEADDEHDKDFVIGSASKRRKNSRGVGILRSQQRRRRVSNKSTTAPVAILVDVGHEDVFLDGNKWDVQARNAKAAQKGAASGVYSSPPESTKSDDDSVEMEDSDNEVEKEDPRDEDFLISRPDFQTRTAASKKQVQPQRQPQGQQSRETRFSQEFSKTKGVPKSSATSGAGASSSNSSGRSSRSSTAATMSLKKVFSTTKGKASSELRGTKAELGRRTSKRISRIGKAAGSGMVTRVKRSVSAKCYAGLPDEEWLSADELCA